MLPGRGVLWNPGALCRCGICPVRQPRVPHAPGSSIPPISRRFAPEDEELPVFTQRAGLSLCQTGAESNPSPDLPAPHSCTQGLAQTFGC